MISSERRAHLEGASPKPATSEEEDYVVNLRIARERTGQRAGFIARGEAIPRGCWTDEEELAALTSELGEVRAETAAFEAQIASAESESAVTRRTVGEVESEIVELNRHPDLVEFNQLTQESTELDRRITAAAQQVKLLSSFTSTGGIL